MKISLVNPSMNFHTTDMPLGILYVASVLRKNGMDVSVIDLSFKSGVEEYRKELLEEKPDVLGFSVMTPKFFDALKYSSIAKDILPDVKVVWGGPHPTALSEETVRRNVIDYLVIGEGEETFLCLMEALESGKDPSGVEGLLFMKGGKMVFTGYRKHEENLDLIPFPARDLLKDRDKYLNGLYTFYPTRRSAIMIGSRGCPFNCTFCQPMIDMLFGKKLRLRSAKNIVDEMEHLVNDFGVKYVRFVDSTFTISEKNVEMFSREVIERKLDIAGFDVNSRVNVFTRRMASDLKRAGCKGVWFGLESGSPYIRNHVMNKNTTNGQIVDAYRNCRDFGLKSQASLMIGTPGETEKTVMETIDIVSRIDPDLLDAHYTLAIPGSRLYDIARENGLLKHKKWDEYEQHSPGTIKVAGMDEERLKFLFNELDCKWRSKKTLGRLLMKKPYILRPWAYFMAKEFASMKDPMETLRVLKYFLAEYDYNFYRALKKVKRAEMQDATLS